MALVRGIDVVYLYVSDLERSIRFYRDTLGLELERHAHNPAWAEARLENGVRFALHEAGSHVPELSSGTIEVSLRVEDVDAACEALSAAGADVGEVMRESWGTLCRFTDPDGYRLGLFAPARPPDARSSRGRPGMVRVVAAAVIRCGDRILVWDDYEPETGEIVSVPIAGGVEFGETGEQAIARELDEEIGATATAIRYLGLFEDIFEWAGQKRHELYLVYDVSVAERTVYDAEELQVVEPDGTAYQARWRPLAEFRMSARLVPDGLLDLLERTGAASRR
jgi:predicted enzyme related to lactoylglutathione lyase/ADP-ribose pyrophosphatase YjhB (NUDIX family)